METRLKVTEDELKLKVDSVIELAKSKVCNVGWEISDEGFVIKAFSFKNSHKHEELFDCDPKINVVKLYEAYVRLEEILNEFY